MLFQIYLNLNIFFCSLTFATITHDAFIRFKFEFENSFECITDAVVTNDVSAVFELVCSFECSCSLTSALVTDNISDILEFI